MIDIFECIDSGIKNHPLQANQHILDKTVEAQHQLTKLTSYPGISWNSTAKLQSESIALEFENPMLPSFEVPFYSFNSGVDLNYIIYDGGYKKQLKSAHSASIETQKQQLIIEIESIKSQVIQVYLRILFFEEKANILQITEQKIKDNLNLIKSLHHYGVADKSQVLLWELREMELQSQIGSNLNDRLAQIRHLEALIKTKIPDDTEFMTPILTASMLDGSQDRKEISLITKQKLHLDEQARLLEVTNRPKVFVYGTTGFGYPNPLNFFDDNFSFYAVGGIGVNWKFYDWGKTKKEKELIKLQQNILDNQINQIENIVSQQDEKYSLLFTKYEMLINSQTGFIQKLKEIAALQKSKVENGTLLPVEHLRSLNEVMESELKMSQLQLELLKTKLEYILIKGKI